jgi:DNA-binding transcriptional ArsR family regulator
VDDERRGPATGRRVVEDLDALRALAHPERSAILRLLMSGRSQTATECAHVVDASPSACSYHLRQLERFGFVERDDAALDGQLVDGRTRRWKAAAIGFSLGSARVSEATPEQLAVYAALRHADRSVHERLERNFLRHFGELPAEWQNSSQFSSYELHVTPEEITQLLVAVDELLLPYRAGGRTGAAGDARPVHVQLSAFRRIDDQDVT